MTQEEEKKAIIKELQSLAEHVHVLKMDHRQKRPIVIEFSGSPKAGKTSCINSLELFLKRNGFSVRIVQERASVCPVSDKQSPMFNIWTACMSLAGMIGTLEDKNSSVDVLILDRGVFDALCWFEWLSKYGKMEREQRELAERFLLMKEIVHSIDIVFAFCVTPEISIQREYANLLTNKPGSIMNHAVLQSHLNAIEETIKTKADRFHNVFKIETTNKNQDDVGKEVTKKTLDTLSELLMERVGFFNKTDELMRRLTSNSFFTHKELSECLNEQVMEFDFRNRVESDDSLLQPIPIAVIVNNKNEILAVKKNAKATSDKSPEKDKILPYIGGHSRAEDVISAKSENFLDICRFTLKREIREEIGISVALGELYPNYIYTPSNEKSKKHLAVCFFVSVPDDVKLRLDSVELVSNKGRTKSGRFFPAKELINENLEEWGAQILEHYFGVTPPPTLFTDNQLE